MRTFEEEVAANDPRRKLRGNRLGRITLITVALVLGGAWLFGIVDAPSGFDAYRKAEQYVKGRLPLTTEFRIPDWDRDYPFSEAPDGDVYCHFWVRDPGQKEEEFRHVGVVMRRVLRFYRIEL